nr:MAG: hypothetical protein [Microvirus sp.]
MQNYNLGSLANWRQIGIGEVLELDIPEVGFRSVAFDVMASGTVAIHAVSGEDYWLVGYGQGEIAVKFATDRPVGVVAIGDSAIDVFIRTLVDAPVIPESLEASYTTIEPRPAGPSDDMRKIMHMVRINAERREAELAREREELYAEMQALRAEVARSPESAPVGPSGDGQVTE